MARLLLVLALLAGAVSDAVAQQPDLNLGRDLAAACANCHGTNGASRAGMPGLAGRDPSELARLMRDFRSGKRPATVMHQIAKGYSDEQVAAIAAYFAAQKAGDAR
jgi:sulfide dehydrogenase cytochrome subunit